MLKIDDALSRKYFFFLYIFYLFILFWDKYHNEKRKKNSNIFILKHCRNWFLFITFFDAKEINFPQTFHTCKYKRNMRKGSHECGAPMYNKLILFI